MPSILFIYLGPTCCNLGICSVCSLKGIGNLILHADAKVMEFVGDTV